MAHYLSPSSAMTSSSLLSFLLPTATHPSRAALSVGTLVNVQATAVALATKLGRAPLAACRDDGDKVEPAPQPKAFGAVVSAIKAANVSETLLPTASDESADADDADGVGDGADLPKTPAASTAPAASPGAAISAAPISLPAVAPNQVEVDDPLTTERRERRETGIGGALKERPGRQQRWGGSATESADGAAAGSATGAGASDFFSEENLDRRRRKREQILASAFSASARSTPVLDETTVPNAREAEAVKQSADRAAECATDVKRALRHTRARIPPAGISSAGMPPAAVPTAGVLLASVPPAGTLPFTCNAQLAAESSISELLHAAYGCTAEYGRCVHNMTEMGSVGTSGEGAHAKPFGASEMNKVHARRHARYEHSGHTDHARHSHAGSAGDQRVIRATTVSPPRRRRGTSHGAPSCNAPFCSNSPPNLPPNLPSKAHGDADYPHLAQRRKRHPKLSIDHSAERHRDGKRTHVRIRSPPALSGSKDSHGSHSRASGRLRRQRTSPQHLSGRGRAVCAEGDWTGDQRSDPRHDQRCELPPLGACGRSAAHSHEFPIVTSAASLVSMHDATAQEAARRYVSALAEEKDPFMLSC